MSHITTIGNHCFIHDGGYDGDVEIHGFEDGYTETVAVLPIWELVGFVAEAVRSRRMSNLEAAGVNELLGMDT